MGLGVLLNQQADRAAAYWGSQLEVTVFLCRDGDDNPACTGEVTDAERDAVAATLEDNPEVSGLRYESSEEAFDKVKQLYGAERFEGPKPRRHRRRAAAVALGRARRPPGVRGGAQRRRGARGVSSIRDQRAVLEPIFTSINALQWGRSASRRSWCWPR